MPSPALAYISPLNTLPSRPSEQARHWPELVAARRVTDVEELIGGRLARSRADGSAPPRIAGRYLVSRLLARGGFGLVVEAEDANLRRPVAVKLIPLGGTSADVVDRVAREGRALALLDHPGVVRVFDTGITELEMDGVSQPTLFIAMERIAGETLGSVMADGPSFADALTLLAGAGLGLEAVHRAGLVHRDVKPDNVVVTESGRVVLVDFGLARAAEDVRGSHRVVSSESSASAAARLGPFRTQVAGPVGTPEYMAPEVQDGAPCTFASDQWAFAAMAWEMLTGTRPEVHGQRVRLRRKWRVPGGLRRDLEVALRVSPADRHPNVGQLVSSLAFWSPERARKRAGLVRAAKISAVCVVALAATPMWAPVAHGVLDGAHAAVGALWGLAGVEVGPM